MCIYLHHSIYLVINHSKKNSKKAHFIIVRLTFLVKINSHLY